MAQWSRQGMLIACVMLACSGGRKGGSSPIQSPPADAGPAVREVVSQGPLRTLGHDGSVNSVAFSPDGTLLASGTSTNTITLWDVASGTVVRTLGIYDSRVDPSKSHREPVNSVAFSPNGTQLASGSDDHTVKLWDVATGTVVREFIGHKEPVTSVAFTPDSYQLASGSAGFDEGSGTVKLWQVASGKEVLTLSGRVGQVTSVAFSPNSARLAVASVDHTVRLTVPWGAGSPLGLSSDGRFAFSELLTLPGSERVNSVVFSPDGTQLASAGSDNMVRLWDVASATEVATFAGHDDDINAVAFSPDGTLLASASNSYGVSGVLLFWDLESDRPVRDLVGHGQDVRAVAFSPDGTLLASGGLDHTVKLWDTASGAP